MKASLPGGYKFPAGSLLAVTFCVDPIVLTVGGRLELPVGSGSLSLSPKFSSHGCVSSVFHCSFYVLLYFVLLC